MSSSFATYAISSYQSLARSKQSSPATLVCSWSNAYPATKIFPVIGLILLQIVLLLRLRAVEARWENRVVD